MTKQKIEVGRDEWPQYVMDRIDGIYRHLVRMKAVNDAHRHILDAVVATHPNPEALAKLLRDIRPGLVDELITGENPSELEAASREAWKHELAHFDKMVQLVIEQPRSGDD